MPTSHPKKILLICAFHPDSATIASNRLRGLAKYLPRFGYEVTIFANEKSPAHSQYNIVSAQSTMEMLPSSVKLREKIIHRFIDRFQRFISDGQRDRLFDSLFSYPDFLREWYYAGPPIARKLMQMENFAAVVSSAPPHTAHLIAHQLKKEFRVPWIADLRDLWTQNHYYKRYWWRKIIDRHLEKKTFRSADCLVTVSKPLAEKLEDSHPHRPVRVITNGFDPDEMNLAKLRPTKFLTILHTGILYDDRRNPEPLFRTIADLISEKTIDPQKIRIKFYGPNNDNVTNLITKYRLQHIVQQKAMIPRSQILLRQREAQILLLLRWANPAEKGVYTGKIFEYLAAQRPILAIGGSPGVVEELLNSTKAGYSPQSDTELKTLLRRWYREFETTGMVRYHGQQELMEPFSQIQMAKKFAETLDQLLRQASVK